MAAEIEEPETQWGFVSPAKKIKKKMRRFEFLIALSLDQWRA